MEWTDRQEVTYSERGFGETGRALYEEKKPENKGFITIIFKYIGNPPKKVLDVACNDGSITKLLKDKGYDAIGVDLPKIIEKAKKVNPSCDLRVLDVDSETDNAPHFKDTFDFIYAGAIIEHVVYDVQFLKRMYSYLKSDGIILLTAPKNQESISKSHIRFYPPESLKKIMTYGCGFKVIAMGFIDRDNLTFVVAKK